MSVNIIGSSTEYQSAIDKIVNSAGRTQGVVGTFRKNYSTIERIGFAVAAIFLTLATLFTGLFSEDVRNMWRIALYAHSEQTCTVWLPSVAPAPSVSTPNVPAVTLQSTVPSGPVLPPNPGLFSSASNAASVTAAVATAIVSPPVEVVTAVAAPSTHFTLDQMKKYVKNSGIILAGTSNGREALTQLQACDQLDRLSSTEFSLLSAALVEVEKVIKSGNSNQYLSRAGNLPETITLELRSSTPWMACTLGNQNQSISISPTTWTAIVVGMFSENGRVFASCTRSRIELKQFTIF